MIVSSPELTRSSAIRIGVPRAGLGSRIRRRVETSFQTRAFSSSEGGGGEAGFGGAAQPVRNSGTRILKGIIVPDVVTVSGRRITGLKEIFMLLLALALSTQSFDAGLTALAQDKDGFEPLFNEKD